MRAPWAASIAGLLFAALFTGSLLFMRLQPTIGASDQELADIYARGEDLAAFIGGMYMAPFAGIMFVWFMAVVRDQIGEREDQFFATVFLGSGLLFVAVYFAAIAVASAPVVGVRYLGLDAPTSGEIQVFQQVSYSLMFGFGTRAAAVFLMAMASIGLGAACSRAGSLVSVTSSRSCCSWWWHSGTGSSSRSPPGSHWSAPTSCVGSGGAHGQPEWVRDRSARGQSPAIVPVVPHRSLRDIRTVGSKSRVGDAIDRHTAQQVPGT